MTKKQEFLSGLINATFKVNEDVYTVGGSCLGTRGVHHVATIYTDKVGDKRFIRLKSCRATMTEVLRARRWFLKQGIKAEVKIMKWGPWGCGGQKFDYIRIEVDQWPW